MRTDDRLYPAYLGCLTLFLLFRSPGSRQLFLAMSDVYWLARDGQLDHL